MKRLILFSLLFGGCLRYASAQDCLGTNTEEKKILKVINSLPEVVGENSRRKKDHIEDYVKAYIQIQPNTKDKFYMVTISEEKHGRLFTYDWYKVYTGTYEIKHYDMIEGETLSLSDWRRKHKRHQ